MDRIIQIIPAPSNLYFKYTGDSDGCSDDPIVCLALVEGTDGERRIKPISFFDDLFDGESSDVDWIATFSE